VNKREPKLKLKGTSAFPRLVRKTFKDVAEHIGKHAESEMFASLLCQTEGDELTKEEHGTVWPSVS